jgi:hypothetical protein
VEVVAEAAPAALESAPVAWNAPAPNPPLAMGLAGIHDWSTEQPFVDLMKTARSWIGHLPDQWGGWDHAALAAGGYLDANGWPVAVPEALTGITTLILTDQPADAASLAGRYRLTYQGEGVIELGGRATNVRYGRGEIWFDYAPGEGFVILTIAATDPRRTGDHVRDIAVVKAENVALHEAGAIFNPGWIARVRHLRAVRFMDWMATNDSEASDWARRPKPGDFSYAPAGAPVEIMVALANEIGADPWFTLPHRATDGWMRSFAEYVRDHLDPRLKAHVEYSNELWNWQFGQARWADAEARARWGADAPDDAWMQFAGMRAAEMAQIWDDVFGPDADRRLVKVIATQTGWLGLESPLLEAPLWVAEDPGHRPPVAYFDAYAVTGYFGGALGNEKAAAVRGWIAGSRATAAAEADARGLNGRAHAAFVETHGFDRAVAQAAAELRDGSVTGDPGDSLGELLGRTLPYQAEVARAHGLDLIMYEGGTHVVGIGPAVDDPDLTAFFTRLNYAPEMGALYAELLDGWRRLGGTLFNAFVDVYPPGKWGSWGALRHLDDGNPRWEALASFNQTSAWWDGPRAAFADGVTLSGTDAADTLRGTPEEDTLLGGAGDDLLYGGAGDRLHGGAGQDTAELPGRRADYRFAADGAALTAAGPHGATRLVAVERIRFTGEPGATVAAADLPSRQ